MDSDNKERKELLPEDIANTAEEHEKATQTAISELNRVTDVDLESPVRDLVKKIEELGAKEGVDFEAIDKALEEAAAEIWKINHGLDRELGMIERDLIAEKEKVRRRCLDLRNGVEEIEQMKKELDTMVPGVLSPGQKAWLIRERNILEVERASALRGALLRLAADMSDVLDSWKNFDAWLFKMSGGAFGKELHPLEEKSILSVDQAIFDKLKKKE